MQSTAPVAFEFHSFDIRAANATQPRAINSSGWIVGTYTDTATGPFHAFLRDPNGRIKTIDVPGAAFTVATGIDEIGRVVGFWSPDAAASVQHGFVRDAAGTLTSFDAPGFSHTAAYGINTQGGLVLNLLNQPGPSIPHYRNPAGAYVAIGPGGLTGVEVHGLNDAGQVVGQASKGSGTTRAFVTSIGSSTNPEPFEYPDSTSSVANGINDAGVIAGSWTSGAGSAQVTHGFIRNPARLFFPVDYPGAVATAVTAISNGGWLTGSYTDSDGAQHGFVSVPASIEHSPDLVSIDVPGAQRTAARAINAAGEICGTYDKGSFGDTHSFVRDAAGNITLFDVPGSAITVALGINDLGQVVGYWSPEIYGSVSHAFIRQPSGEIASFDAPKADFNSAGGVNNSGAMTLNGLTQPGPNRPLRRDPAGAYTEVSVGGSTSVYATGLNQAGDMTGYLYVDNVQKAFVLRSDGSSLVFTAPLATTATAANAINDAGVVVGYYSTGYRGGSQAHAYVRLPSGDVETLDVPGATATLAFGINDAGFIVGYYDDPEGRQRGYVMALPARRWPLTVSTPGR